MSSNKDNWRVKWTNRSLRSKFLIIFVAVVVGFNLGFFAIWQPKANQFIVDKLSREVRRQLLTLGDGMMPFLLQNQLAAIHETLDVVKERQDNWIEIELTETGGGRIYPLFLSDEPDNRTFFRLEEPIIFRGETVVTIAATVDFSQEQSSLKRQGYALFAGATGLFVFAMLIVAVFFEVLVGRRAVKLSSAADSLAKGDFDAELPEVTGDEIGRLVQSFADMRETVYLTQNSLSKAREQAESATKIKSQFLAVMSHEIRTPLNGLLGTIQLLQTTDLSPQQRKYLSVMASSGEFLKHHVDDVLDLSQLDAGKVQIINTCFDLRKMLQDVVDGMKHFADQRGNTLCINAPVGPCNIWGDTRRIRQVLYNMLSNAIKFTKDGEICIEVLSTQDDPEQSITVTDTGIGITDVDLGRIFSDFETVDSSHVRDSNGTGLGLGISRRLARAMGGEIVAVSEIGKGSCFQFSWRSENTEQKTAIPPIQITPPIFASSAAGKSLKILVVEDNQINRFVVREMLEKAGHSVHEAENGKIGTEMAAIDQFEIILMDISMPIMDGITATKTIRAGNGASSKTPIVALTAHSTAQDRETFIEAGMDETLLKPISLDVLTQTVRALASNTEKAAPRPADVSDTETEIIDLAHFNQFTSDIGEAKVAELFMRFSADVFQSMERLQMMANTEWNFLEAAEIVHKMAGSAAMFGAVCFRNHLSQAEDCAKNGNGVKLAALLTELKRIWEITTHRIENTGLGR